MFSLVINIFVDCRLWVPIIISLASDFQRREKVFFLQCQCEVLPENFNFNCIALLSNHTISVLNLSGLPFPSFVASCFLDEQHERAGPLIWTHVFLIWTKRLNPLFLCCCIPACKISSCGRNFFKWVYIFFITHFCMCIIFADTMNKKLIFMLFLQEE